MEFGKKFEFYWQGESKQTRDIYTEKFNNELDSEIAFFESNGFAELVQVLKTFKTRKNAYENNSGNSGTLQQLNQSINIVDWMYSECKSVIKYNIIKQAIIDRIFTSNTPLRKKLLPLNQNDRATPLVNDVEIGFYYNFKLKDYVEPDLITYYKSELDNALLLSQNNNQKILENHDLYNQKINNTLVEYENEVKLNISSYKKEMNDLEQQYQKKLQFDKPSEFWNTKSTDYKTTSNKWLIASGVVTVILLTVTIFISTLIFDITWNSNLITIEMIGFSKDLTFGNILLITAIESIIIYILKTCIKYYDYNLKLYEFYKSKAMLSSFYVTIKDDDLSEPIKEKIYTQLFASSNIDFDKVED